MQNGRLGAKDFRSRHSGFPRHQPMVVTINQYAFRRSVIEFSFIAPWSRAYKCDRHQAAYDNLVRHLKTEMRRKVTL